PDASLIIPIDNLWVSRVDHGMIRPESVPTRAQISAIPDSTFTNPEQRIADLERQLAEAREQQTATAEVLQVINLYPGDLTPVFEAILEKAHTLCGADHGAMFLRNGETLHAIASRGVPEAFAEHLRQGFRANEAALSKPLLASEPFVQLNETAL